MIFKSQMYTYPAYWNKAFASGKYVWTAAQYNSVNYKEILKVPEHMLYYLLNCMKLCGLRPL